MLENVIDEETQARGTAERKYEPIDNDAVEELLTSVERNAPDKYYKLKKFVERKLLSERSSVNGDGEIDLITKSLEFLLEKNSRKKRRIGDRLESTHQIDTVRALIYHDKGNSIDYTTIIAALFHDILEDTNVTADTLREFLKNRVGELQQPEMFRQGVDEVPATVQRLTRSKSDYYNEYLGRVYKSENVRAMKIKLADKITQSYEMDESPYYGRVGKWKDEFKHKIVRRYGEDSITRLKQREDLFARIVLFPVYNWFEHLEIPGNEICLAAFEHIMNIDFSCRYINQGQYDATLVALKNAHINATGEGMIMPRKMHLVEGYHVSEDRAKAITDDVAKYVGTEGEDFFRVTEISPEDCVVRSKNDIIAKYYIPAMRGKTELLEHLELEKDSQYQHLSLFEWLLDAYANDCTRDADERLRHRGLFTFDWGM